VIISFFQNIPEVEQNPEVARVIMSRELAQRYVKLLCGLMDWYPVKSEEKKGGAM